MNSETASTRESAFLSTLVEINHEITSILNLDQLLKKIAELTGRIVPYQIFAIFLVDDARQDLYYRFGIGHAKDIVQGLRIGFGEGLIGTAAAERKPVVVDDVRNDPRYIEVVEAARSELAVPLISKNRVVGVLDIESPEVGYFREEQVRLLNLLASQIAIAIENAKIYESERRSSQTLALLYDVSLEMSSTLEVDEVIRKIAAAVRSAVDYQIFSIFQLDERAGTLQPKVIIRSNEREFRKLSVPLGKGLVGAAALLKKPVRVGHVLSDPRYIPVHEETRSEMVVPLTYKGRVIGVVDLESTEVEYFTEYHQQLLMTLASRIASALVNAELYARVSENERRMDREMKIAREIQLRLMPEEIPSVDPLDIAVTFKSVAHLGGDLYDFIEFDDGRLAIVVGDVAGKGAPAALYAALSSGIIRTRATRKYPPGQMLELVNKTLYERPIESQYCALTYAVFEPKTRTIAMANSGLPYPLLLRDGSARFLDLAGIPVGLLPETKYQELELQLLPGDVLVLYSDGLVEARNETDEDFGLKRLAQVITENGGESAQHIVTAVNNAVDEFVGRVPPHDDRTLIVIGVNSD
ncbi:MAG TPA: GAF domain-containing SpoIIE family protein phosphatase [Terriglobia bacterium]|nr:GAF domain-containing SpoIIE family protein phosphatase [Terriglobia bacterium]